MSKTFRLLIVAALLSLSFGVGKATAATNTRTSTDWTDNGLTIPALDLGTSQVSEGSFAPSGSVRATYTADNITGVFIGAAQHAKGDKMYGMYGSGGKLYASGVTLGTFLAPTFNLAATDTTSLGGVTTFVAQ